MEKTKHTPGPWVIEKVEWAEKGHVFISAKDHGALAQVVWVMEDDEYLGRNSPVCEANARLISAAPELLEALQMAISYIAVMHGTPDYEDRFADQILISVHKQVDAAIAKATGA